jgi:hypothetical protein
MVEPLVAKGKKKGKHDEKDIDLYAGIINVIN